MRAQGEAAGREEARKREQLLAQQLAALEAKSAVMAPLQQMGQTMHLMALSMAQQFAPQVAACSLPRASLVLRAQNWL